VTRVLSS